MDDGSEHLLKINRDIISKTGKQNLMHLDHQNGFSDYPSLTQ